MKAKFNIVSLYSEFAEDKVSHYTGKYSHALEDAGGAFISSDYINKDNPVFLFIISGGSEQLALDFINENNMEDEIIFIIAHSENNSLPAALETTAKLNQESIKTQLFFLDASADCSTTVNEIRKAALYAETKKELSKSKIGLIGEPSDWLVASSPKCSVVNSIWGPTVETIPLDEVYSKFDCINAEAPEEIKISEEFIKKASKLKGVLRPDISEAVKVYIALKQIVEEKQLSAITVKCFDIVKKLNTTGCFALAKLNDEGIIAGCEGDIVSAVTMLWIYKLTGILPWMANPTNINLETNTLNLAHCTVPLKLIDKYTVKTHYESNIGVAIEGKMPHSPVTMIRVGGKNMDKIWAARGKILNNTEFKNSCRTQIKVEFENKNMLKQLLTNPLGNHTILCYGFHKEDLEYYFRNYIN